MAKKQLIREKTDETIIDNNKAITPKSKKVVTSKSGKTGARNTAPKKIKNDEVAAVPIPEKVVVKKTPAKRTPKKEVSKVEATPNVPVAERIGPAKTKNITDSRYIRVANDAGIEKFREMGNRIQSKTLQWAYYAVDGDKGYHYYLVLN